MSFESWVKEFYPVKAEDCPREEAAAHSLQKWKGALPENLEKHGVKFEGYKLFDELHSINFNYSSCALCARNSYCSTCSLTIVRGGVDCSARRKDEDTPSYNSKDAASVGRMIVWLERAVAYEKGEFEPIPNVKKE